ncbi:MAG: exodeoxyribonuclease VII large subunit [Paracoccaceae bacterium]
MSDLIDTPDAGQNAPEFSVSEISGVVKRMIEGEFSHVRIRGEVGRVSRPASGHLYLDLKDDRAVLASVIWKGVAGRLRVQPEEGMEVVATGRLTTFPGQSRYQMVIEDIAPAGVGALMAMLEKRKAALGNEGLFKAELKQPLPYLPDVIGVITSPSGAVIRDILHRLRDRFPRKVLIWPVVVQGDKCAPEVAAAIKGFNAMKPGGALPRPDVLIVARGGGSIEDLWGFNEEVVVRAAFASKIPLISAVGHETDTTLIDYVSDKRAPTPTAAAEMAVPVRADLSAHVAGLEERRRRALARGLEQRRQRLRDVARSLPRGEGLLAERVQRLDGLAMRLPMALSNLTHRKRAQLAARGAERLNLSALRADITRKSRDVSAWSARLMPALMRSIKEPQRQLDALGRTLETLSYRKTLARGYAVVRAEGDVVASRKLAAKQDALEIEFVDGRLAVSSDGKPVKKKPQKPNTPSGGGTQGSLF